MKQSKYLDGLSPEHKLRIEATNFTHFRIPIQVLTDDRLTPAAIKIYSIINASAKTEKGSYICNRTIMTLTGLNQSSVSKAYKDLTDLGLIKMQILTGGKRTAWITEDLIKIAEKDVEKRRSDPNGKTLGSLMEKHYVYKGTLKEHISKEILIHQTSLVGDDLNEIIPRRKRTKPPMNKTKINVKERLANRFPNKNKTTPRKPVVDPIIEFWNSLPFTRKHNDPATNTYRAARKLLNALRRGKFDNYLFDQDWIKASGIPSTVVTRKWTDGMLRKAIVNTAKLFDPAHWPTKKKSFPSDLASLLYNPATMKSQIIKYRQTPPPLLADENKKNTRGKLSGRALAIVSNLEKSFGHSSNGVYPKAAELLMSIFEKNNDDRHKKFSARFGSANELVDDYISFAEDSLGSRKAPQLVGITSKVWIMYASELGRRYGVRT